MRPRPIYLILVGVKESVKNRIRRKNYIDIKKLIIYINTCEEYK